MKKFIAVSLVFMLLFPPLLTIKSGAVSQRKDAATYYMPAEDYGIVLEPSMLGEEFYQYDGNGIREGIVNKVGDTYYLFYDGAGAHTGTCFQNDPYKHLWRAMLAKSTDLIHWEKLGVKLWTGYDIDPTSSKAVYKDFASASSPWCYFNEEEDYWYMFYLGAEEACPSGEDIGTPSTYYSTLVAKAKTKGSLGIEGEWQQLNQLPGQQKAVALWQPPVSATCSPGSVIQNPLWTPGDTINKRYMMFITRGDQIQIARSNTLDGVHNFDEAPDPNGWNFDKQILDTSRKTAPENAVIYFDDKTGWYFLFTNQFSMDFTYADCNIVYWSKDPNNWNPKNCATITDTTSTKDNWSTGVIGMPSVVKVDDETLAIIYDGALGGSTAHTQRRLGLGYWKIPNLDENGVPIGYKSTLTINNNDQQIKYTGSFVHATNSNPNDINGDLHYTNVIGDYIEFEFWGTTIKWIGEKAFNRGTAEVFIDGVSQGIINAYDSSVLYQQELFEKNDLPNGKHKIKIVCLENKYIDLDAFKIDQPAAAPIMNNDTSYLKSKVLEMSFDNNIVEDGNWTLLNASINYFTNNKFVKSSPDNWVGFYTKDDFGQNTITTADLMVLDHPDAPHTRMFVGVRCTGSYVVTQDANGIWFGFSKNNELVISLNGVAQTAGNTVTIPCIMDFSTSQKIEIHDNGNIINLYGYLDNEKVLLATVDVSNAEVIVKNANGNVVFTKNQAVNTKGTISFVAFGATGEIDNITVSSKQNLLVTPTNVTTFNGTDGKITVTVLGNSTYEYSKDNGVNWQDSNIFNSLTAGTYKIIIREKTNTSNVSAATDITITQPAQVMPVTSTVTQTNVTTLNGTDGKITVIASGGAGIYEYSDDNGSTWQISNVFSGLQAGTYTIIARDKNDTENVSFGTQITISTSVNQNPNTRDNLALELAIAGVILSTSVVVISKKKKAKA